jgi:hypothetical protein
VLVEAWLLAEPVQPRWDAGIDGERISMTMRWRLCLSAAAVSLTAAVGGLLVAGPANAQAATTASLSFSGDSGDFISQGKSWSYSTSHGDVLDVSGSASGVHIGITGYNGDWWTLDIAAPSQPIPGQPASLVPGTTYSNAHRYPFNGTGPGLSLSGNGRGCNQLTGSYTITNAVFGPNNYVQTFDATFEQHCENGTPAARGQVHVSNPPPPSQPAPTGGGGGGGGVHTSNPSPPSQATPQPGADNTSAGTQPRTTAAASSTRGQSSFLNGSTRARLALIGLGVIAWVVQVVVGFIAAGIALAVRRR